MSLIKKFVISIILINFSFTVVNALGIFPIKSSSSWIISHDQIVKLMNQVTNRFNNAASAFDYFTAAGFSLMTGLQILISFIISIFTGFPAVLEAFFIPPELAVPIGCAVDCLLLVGLGYLFISRI